MGIAVVSGATITSTGTGANAANITLNGTGANGTNQNYGIWLNSSTSKISTVDGDINVTAKGGDGSSSQNYGLYVSTSADIISTGTGASAGTITLNGTGGNGTSDNYGFYATGSGTTITSAKGLVNITGTGGAGSSTGNHGVQLDTSALITAVNGGIGITGVGRSTGTSSSNHGINVDTSADVTSTGTGASAATITLHGTGATGSGTNMGIVTNGGGTTVTSVDGDISLTGIGQSSGVSSIGIYNTNLTITSAGTGADAATIALNGTGGGGNGSYGIYHYSTTINSVDGNVSMLGQGTFGNSYGIGFISGAGVIDNPINLTGAADLTLTGIAVGTAVGINIWITSGSNNTITATGTSDLTFISDRLSLTGLTAQNSGTLTFKPYSEPTTIGVSGGAGTLQITDALLTNFTGFSRLIIGDSVDGGGAVDVDSLDFSLAGFSNMRGFEAHGGSIDVDTITGATNMDMYFGATGLNASTGVVDLDSIGLINNDGVDRTFYSRSAASTLMSGSALFSSSGALRALINADSDGNSAGAIRLTATAFTTLGGEVILSGGNSGQTALSAADLTYLRSTGRAWGVTGEVEGIELNNSDITVTTGNVTLRGHGWNAGAGGGNNYGISLGTDADIVSGGTGASVGGITLDGIGGNATSSNNGIYVAGATTSITSVDGDISLTGLGGNGTATGNTGIAVSNSAVISSSGTGANAASISLTGTGGDSTSSNWGILLSTPTLSSIDGDISLVGIGAPGASGFSKGLA